MGEMPPSEASRFLPFCMSRQSQGSCLLIPNYPSVDLEEILNTCEQQPSTCSWFICIFPVCPQTAALPLSHGGVPVPKHFLLEGLEAEVAIFHQLQGLPFKKREEDGFRMRWHTFSLGPLSLSPGPLLLFCSGKLNEFAQGRKNIYF